MEELECSLLGLVAGLDKVLEGLLAGGGGTAAYNASVLVLLESRAGESTGCVVGGSVVDLSTGTNSLHSTTCCIALILTSVVNHFCCFYLNKRFFSRDEQFLSLYTPALRTVFSIQVSRSANSSVGSNDLAC